jgi:glucosamine 6-phosphate synthetase-like amidotransferase/phosphosugar isomerase protein
VNAAMRLQGCIAVFTPSHCCASHRNNYLQKSESSIVQIRGFTIESAERVLYHHIMEKRITTLEVTATQTCKSMDHLERSVADLRSEMHHSVSDLRRDIDRKFIWMMGTQIAALIAIMSAMAKLAHLF